jgi:hypothetical protein
MQNSGLYYKQLCEELTQRIKLLEAMLSKKKKKKKSKLDPVGKEDEDIDNDGKANTSRDEYLKNRREAIGQEMKNKKKTINEGTVVTDGYIFYGGFPKKLNEEGLVNQYNDADDAPGEPSIAALTDELEQTRATLDQASYELDKPRSAFASTGKGQAMMKKILNLEKRIKSHPDYKRK